MVFFQDEAGDALAQRPRGKPDAAPSKQKDKQVKALGKTRTQQASSAVLQTLDPAIQKAIASTACSAWALTLLHDNSVVSCYSSRNIDQQKSLLFRDDGWDLVRRAVARANAAHLLAAQNAAASSVSGAAPATSHAIIDDEPMSMTASGTESGNSRHAELSSSTKRTSGLPPKPRRNRNRTAQPLQHLTPRKRRHSSTPVSEGCSSQDVQLTTMKGPRFPSVGDFTFVIGDTVAVEFALTRLLNQLQQVALKALETEWIKTAEPNKQSKFPYHSKKRTKQNPDGSIEEFKVDIPPWWPPDTVYKEPHHSSKSVRTRVALALLLLHREEGWVDKLVQASKRVNLYFKSDKTETDPEAHQYELEREKRRAKILDCIFTVAQQEEDCFFDVIDKETQITVEDVPPLRKKKRSKKQAQAADQAPLANSTSRATSAAPSAASSPADLVSPARKLTLHETSSFSAASPASPMEPPPRRARVFETAPDTPMSMTGLVPITMPPNAMPQRIPHHHSFLEEPCHNQGTPCHNPLIHNVPRSQEPTRHHSYDYNAKPSLLAYEEMPPKYEAVHRLQYDFPLTPSPFVSWQPAPLPDCIPPSRPLRYTPFQEFPQSCPGRSDFSFQPQEMMASSTAYEGAVTAPSPMAMTPPAPLMARSYSQSNVDAFQQRAALLGSAETYQEAQYRQGEGMGRGTNGLPTYEMGVPY